MYQNNINVSQERLRLISRGTIHPADKSGGLSLPLDPNAVTPEHKEIIELMPKILSGEIEPDQAMAALWQYDTLKQRGCI